MRTIDLDSLEILRAVVREGGIVRAAARLNRVQSNVTTRIKQLERRLGVALFRREGRSLVPTAAGETLLTYAERMLRLAEEAEAATRAVPLSGPLRLGSMESTAASRLPRLLSRLHRRHPEIRVEVRTATTGALVREVAEWRIDAAFVGEPFCATGLQSRTVFEEELVLVTAKGHGRVRRPADLESATVLAFADGCSYRARLEEWFARDGLMPDRVMELSSYQAIIACAAAGVGCGVVPASVLKTLLAAREVGQHRLPDEIARNRTHLVWTGEMSPKLAPLVALLPKKAD